MPKAWQVPGATLPDSAKGWDSAVRTVAADFERQVAATPDNLAIKTEEASLTYRELDAMAARVAAGMARRDDGEGRPVALLMQEGPALVAAMIGMAKAGRIFIPLEMTSPEAWIAGIIASSGTADILTDTASRPFAERAAGTQAAVLDIEELAATGADAADAAAPSTDSPAFIIYTSGSTGRPKGVAIGHHDFLHRVRMRTELSRLRSGDHAALLHSSGYSAGIITIFASLCSGGCVRPFDVHKHGIHRFSTWLNAEGITVIPTVSSFFRTWLSSLSSDYRCPSVRVIAVGGEALYGTDIARAAARLEGEWTVAYFLGATEAGLTACHWFGPASRPEPGMLPVGRPMKGVELSLQKEDGSATGAGEIGEIVVTSRFLALGYWNDPKLTAASFIGHEPRSYRTGDLGRWREDGLLEHLGRKDSRVKLRGYSIEPHEVECALLRISGVQNAAVMLREDTPGKPELVGYVVATGVPANTPEGIRASLAQQLPGQMVPARIVVLESMPLTARGKVDRAALAAPQVQSTNSGREPEGYFECTLAGIWRDVMNLPAIGTEDDFFELGGTSLQAFLIFAQIATVLRRDLAPTTMLRAATIAKQAELLHRTEVHDDSIIAVPFRRSHSGRPLFIVHGGIGDIMFVRAIVRDLKSDRAVYGLQPRPLDGSGRLARTLERTAEDYLGEIAHIQETGPYALAGYSFGGWVALEMAQQLVRRGERVEFLGLIDTLYAPKYLVANETPAARIGRHTRSLRQLNLGAMLRYASPRVVKTMVLAFRNATRASLHFQDWARERAGLKVFYGRRARYYFWIFARMVARYTAKPYQGEITVFSALGRTELHRARWGRIALGGLRIHEIPAMHREMVWPPHSAKIAEGLDAAFNRPSSDASWREGADAATHREFVPLGADLRTGV